MKVDDTERVLDQKATFVVQDVSKPMYRQFIHEPVDKDMLKIKAELFVEVRKSK